MKYGKWKLVTISLPRKAIARLNQVKRTTGVSKSKQITFHILGKPHKVKKVGDM